MYYYLDFSHLLQFERLLHDTICLYKPVTSRHKPESPEFVIMNGVALVRIRQKNQKPCNLDQVFFLIKSNKTP